uniref:NACHT domain-containing protein n=1 Tax=Trichuris muris TaxID=70415 RepID=A0A5S6QWH5_TRIMR
MWNVHDELEGFRGVRSRQRRTTLKKRSVLGGVESYLRKEKWRIFSATLAADVKFNQRICMPVLRPLAWATMYTSKGEQSCCFEELLTTRFCCCQGLMAHGQLRVGFSWQATRKGVSTEDVPLAASTGQIDLPALADIARDEECLVLKLDFILPRLFTFDFGQTSLLWTPSGLFQPQVHLPSTNSLQLIHRLLDNLISRHEEQAPSVRVHLSQVLLFFWCPNELKDERRLFYLDILHELQVACLSYGAEVIIVDPFEWYGSSVAIQPDMLSLFLQELCHCKRFSSGPFFVAITCEQCNTFVLPSVLAEEVVSQLTTHFSEQKRPFPFSDLYQTVQDSKGRRYFELKRFDTLGQKGLDAYALLCMRLETCRQTEQDEPWLSKIFPYLYELLISRASEGEAQFNNRSLVVWKRDIAVTKLNLHQGDDSSHDRASCLGSQRSSGLSTCDVEILMAPLVHVQTFSDPSSTTFIKQGSLDSYLRKFYYRVSTKLKCKIQAGLDVGRSESDEDQLLLSFKEDGIVHCQYALCHQKDILLGQDSLVSQVKAAFEKINAGQRSIAILKGSHGQGKTALLCHIADEVSSWMDIGYVVLRFARLTPLSSTIHELLLGCCLELCGQFQLKTILPDRVSRYSIQQIFDWLKECCDQVAYKTCGKPVLLLVDDIHRLKESSSISDSKLPFWLPTRLPPNMLFLATLNEEVHLEQRFYTDVVTRDCIFAIPPLLADNCRLLYERYIDRGGDGVQLLSNDSRLDGMGACPLAIRMLAEMPETVEWISSEQANEPANVLTKLAALVDARFRMAERRCGSLICRFALSYIECAHFGLTLGELLDLLTCCEPAMHEVLSKAGKDQEVHQFPLAIWLKLKQCLGCLLEEVVCDGRTVYKWAHRFVVGVVRRRYLCTVQELKDCHMSLATLLNSTLSPIGIMDSAALNVKLRPVMPRPLVYASNDGTPVFNLRVIRSLWYHLLHTGE